MCNGELTFEIYSFCLMKLVLEYIQKNPLTGNICLKSLRQKKHSSTAKMETVPGFSLLKKTGMKELNSESGADFYLFWCND